MHAPRYLTRFLQDNVQYRSLTYNWPYRPCALHPTLMPRQRLGDLYAPGTSRLACQIPVSKELDGLTVFIPDGPPLDGS